MKQSPTAWFGKFNAAMKRFWYRQSNYDHMFLKKCNNQITYGIIYVVDIIIT